MSTESRRRNDDRLDEFAANVDKRFEQVGKRFEQVGKRFEQVGKRFDRIEGRMEQGFNRLNDRLDDLVKVLMGGVIAFSGAMLAGFAGILVLIATQL